MPSSVVGIGVVAQSEQASGAPWFAPAGFNRGGISTLGGASGIKVASSVETLNKADRDDLYQANINPIARFPNEGLVVFGQKTLQQTPSALDRVNVRRLMIYLKKRIGAVARTILFDNNLNATWNRFKSDAEPILIDAQSRFGISEFQLILDETTTTPDYIDRNILYAKVFIKPAYAIEFIAIDFNITRSGIEF
jgi:phage tail sheath protein FI